MSAWPVPTRGVASPLPGLRPVGCAEALDARAIHVDAEPRAIEGRRLRALRVGQHVLGEQELVLPLAVDTREARDPPRDELGGARETPVSPTIVPRWSSSPAARP
jgi:hypothetical protein